jgi:hypothetical protein
LADIIRADEILKQKTTAIYERIEVEIALLKKISVLIVLYASRELPSNHGRCVLDVTRIHINRVGGSIVFDNKYVFPPGRTQSVGEIAVIRRSRSAPSARWKVYDRERGIGGVDRATASVEIGNAVTLRRHPSVQPQVIDEVIHRYNSVSDVEWDLDEVGVIILASEKQALNKTSKGLR